VENLVGMNNVIQYFHSFHDLYFSYEINIGRIILRQFATTLEIFLHITLHKAISLNLSGVLATSFFWIKVIKVEFIALRTINESQESSTTSKTYFFTTSQQAFKRSMVNPLGPEALYWASPEQLV